MKFCTVEITDKVNILRKNILGGGLSMPSAFVYRLKKRKIVQLTEEFGSRQWMDQDKLLGNCDELSLSLIQYAYKHVPYYRNILDYTGIFPSRLKFPEDWQRIPLLNKQDLCSHFEELKSDIGHSQNSYLNHTGGSTGVPVNFLSDLIQNHRMMAWLDLVYSWAGWEPGETRLELWGNDDQRLPLTLWDRCRASLSGHFILPVYEYSESTMQQWALVLEQLAPTIIYGYPSVLSDFAKWLDSEKYQIVGVKGVFCSAEILYPEQRSIIEKVFCCKVFNQYGSRETPCIACECPDGGMHLFVDFNRIEFVDSDESIENKEIIVTPLYNFVQPLIRYRLEDMGRSLETSCACGRGYPLMELTVARSRDVIVGPNGISFYPGFFTRLMDGKERIRAFQFVQKKAYLIELNIEVSGTRDVNIFCEQLAAEITPFLIEKMGNIQFFVNSVKKIDRTSAGKHRYVISEI